MKSPRTIAVLHDSPDFGGHERAFLIWLPAVLASPDIDSLHIRFPEANGAFAEALRGVPHPKLHLAPCPFQKKAAEPFRALLRADYGHDTARFVQEIDADLVMMLQGRIENLATPMTWLPRAMDIVSYLPMAHSGVEMGRPPWASALTDGVKRFYYARPQRFIVPAQAVAAQARKAGARGDIYVVENVPTPSQKALLDREKARVALGLNLNDRIALFMGRFDTHQKGIDDLLGAMRRNAERLKDWTFLFVGGGPAEPEIRRVFSETPIRGQSIGWTSTPELYLAASDILLSPSRYEGVPLVMLEALREGVPILASDIDVYREYLPEFLLHDFRRPVDLPEALAKSTAADSIKAFRTHAEAICVRLDLHTSQQRFLGALLGVPMLLSKTGERPRAQAVPS